MSTSAQTEVPNVYIDTMVFVYKLERTTHRLFPKADAFFSDIEHGTYKGIVSTFLYVEFQAVVKQLLSQAKDLEAPQADVDKEISRLDQFLSDMGIKLYNADILIDQTPVTMFFRTEQLVQAAKPQKGKWDQQWHVIGGTDAIHLALAEAVRANSIATFDQGLKGVNDTSLSVMMLSEVYP
jgi:predicted nucleic acid-binding protein